MRIAATADLHFTPQNYDRIREQMSRVRDQADLLVVAGDLTNYGKPQEMESLLNALVRIRLPIVAVLGNHDHYTRSAYRNLDFYRHFDIPHRPDDAMSFFKLKDDKVSATHLGKEWWLFALDSAQSTSLFSSHGIFSEQVQRNLEHALSFLPPDQKVIMLNHFPFFDTDNKKTLHRGNELQAILERFPQIKLYLHGHTHRHIIADLRPSQLPIVVDSGSTAQKKEGTWNLIDITEYGCDITVYTKGKTDISQPWEMRAHSNFVW